MRYADTCLLVSLFFRDAGTDAALAWMHAAGVEPIMASHWSLTEFSSAAGLRARAGQIAPKLHREAPGEISPLRRQTPDSHRTRTRRLRARGRTA